MNCWNLPTFVVFQLFVIDIRLSTLAWSSRSASTHSDPFFSQTRHPGVAFEVVDVLRAGALEALRGRREWTVVLIDINGNRDVETVLLVLRLCMLVLRPVRRRRH